MSRNMLIIDVNSILKFVCKALPSFVSEKKEEINGLFGFSQVLFSAVKLENFTHICGVVQKTDGKEKYFEEQFAHSVELMKAMQIPLIEAESAMDSIIDQMDAIRRKEGKVFLITADSDLLQMVSSVVQVAMPGSLCENGKFTVYSPETIEESYGLTLEQFCDFLSLQMVRKEIGSQECIFGEKTCIALLKTYESLEKVYEEIDSVYPLLLKQQLVEWKENILEKKAQIAANRTSHSENAGIGKDDANRMDEYETGNMYSAQVWKLLSSYGMTEFEDLFDVQGMEQANIEAYFHEIKTEKELKQLLDLVEHSEQEVVGLQLSVRSGFFSSYFEEEDGCYEEQGGQLSLFEIPAQKQKGILLGVSVACKGQVYFLDCEQSWFEEAQFIKRVLGMFDKKLPMAVLDLKETLYILKRMCQQYDLPTDALNADTMNQMFDLSVAQYLINPLQETYEYEQIAKEYMELELISEKEFLGKQTWEQRKAEDREAYERMLCYQAYVCEMVKPKLEEGLYATEQWELYKTVELPLVYVLFEMEQRGIYINKQELSSYGEKLQVRIEQLEKVIYEEAGEEFNINSPKQLGVVLFEKMGLPYGKKTKTGYSTSAEVLDRLKDEHKIVKDILEYRQLTKLKSTYADGLANYICEKDGRIHGTFNQTITATGRLSSTEPNLQNIPIRMEIGREIRKVFIPKEGYVFLDADYSQIELRILAHMSGDAALIEAYKSGEDIHRITASQVFHTPFEEVTKEQRSNAKAVNFGIVYGISSFGLGQDLNISRKEAEEYIQRYFDTYPNIKKYLDSSVETAKEHGYAVSLMGRRRPVPELSASQFMKRSFGERIAMNSPIQGTAADIMKLAMIRVNDRIKREGLQSELLLQIHDELLVETHPDEIEQVRTILQEEMYGVMELSVPLEVEVEQGMNWNEAH